MLKQTVCDTLQSVIEIQRARREFEVGSETSILENNVRRNLFVGVEGQGGARLVSIHMVPQSLGETLGWHAVWEGMSSRPGKGLQCTERSFSPLAQLKNGLTGRRNSILVSSWLSAGGGSDDELELQPRQSGSGGRHAMIGCTAIANVLNPSGWVLICSV